jgi:hypothetical protein
MRLFRFAVLLSLLPMAAIALPAKDFAPCAPRSQMARQMAQDTGWDSCQGIPSADQVGIPAPPGGEISSLSNLGINLPGIELLSPTPLNEIVNFYKKSLSVSDGWKWNAVLQIFYRGDSVSDALFLKIPSVRISAVSDPAAESFLVDEAFRNKAKTRIEIHYKPVRTTGAPPASKG